MGLTTKLKGSSVDRSTQAWIFSVGLIAVGIVLFGGLFTLVRRWRLRHRRILWDNALKQIIAAKHEGRPVTPSEIAGRLGLSLSAVLRLARELESAELVHSRGGFLELTETGTQRALRILRGHRLWEHYLSGDAQVPLELLHDAAERDEHRLTADEISSLADHLGHPSVDPHGDAIPSPGGEFQPQQRTALTDWPANQLAVIVHIEDEPGQGLREALGAGLRPGTVLRVVARDSDAVVCETSAGRSFVSPAVAAKIDVRPAADDEDLRKPCATLAALSLGEQAAVVALSERCTGLARRRLLDLGFTAGAKVRAVLSNLDDAAHAYEIRGSVIALRREQADQVLVRPIAPNAKPTPAAGEAQGVSPC